MTYTSKDTTAAEPYPRSLADFAASPLDNRPYAIAESLRITQWQLRTTRHDRRVLRR